MVGERFAAGQRTHERLTSCRSNGSVRACIRTLMFKGKQVTKIKVFTLNHENALKLNMDSMVGLVQGQNVLAKVEVKVTESVRLAISNPWIFNHPFCHNSGMVGTVHFFAVDTGLLLDAVGAELCAPDPPERFFIVPQRREVLHNHTSSLADCLSETDVCTYMCLVIMKRLAGAENSVTHTCCLGWCCLGDCFKLIDEDEYRWIEYDTHLIPAAALRYNGNEQQQQQRKKRCPQNWKMYKFKEEWVFGGLLLIICISLWAEEVSLTRPQRTHSPEVRMPCTSQRNSDSPPVRPAKPRIHKSDYIILKQSAFILVRQLETVTKATPAEAVSVSYWILHCHFAYHIIIGMEIIFKVGDKEDFPPVPLGFPRCGSFTPPILTDCEY
ncbi:hypothetical protein PR048_026933 [Dryococelus australis]|uniref:Uncharacterized protein n=1 Tax=Dryococelus australis TaxID=614101 RepID=A0ABQ9GMQ6_9NEOP|nr:hypothetical protein PR048_026933 [Dryococelus australis]